MDYIIGRFFEIFSKALTLDRKKITLKQLCERNYERKKYV